MEYFFEFFGNVLNRINLDTLWFIKLYAFKKNIGLITYIKLVALM